MYAVATGSSPFQRQCCGPGREFSMSIVDNTQREVGTPLLVSLPALQEGEGSGKVHAFLVPG